MAKQIILDKLLKQVLLFFDVACQNEINMFVATWAKKRYVYHYTNFNDKFIPINFSAYRNHYKNNYLGVPWSI